MYKCTRSCSHQTPLLWLLASTLAEDQVFILWQTWNRAAQVSERAVREEGGSKEGIQWTYEGKKFSKVFFNNHVLGDSISIVILRLSTILGEHFGIKQKKKNYVGVVEKQALPWLAWLSGSSASLRTKGLLVRFPVRFPVGSMQEAATHWHFSPSISLSLPLSLKNKF